MFTQQEYLSAWAIYLAASLVFLFGFWKLCGLFKWRESRILLIVPLAVFVLTPWSVSITSDFLSPGWITAILEGFLEGDGAFWRAGMPVLLATLAALLVVTLARLIMSSAQVGSSAGQGE